MGRWESGMEGWWDGGIVRQWDSKVVERWVRNSENLSSNTGHCGYRCYHCEYNLLTLIHAQNKKSHYEVECCDWSARSAPC